MVAVGHKMTHAGSSIPPLVCLSQILHHLHPFPSSSEFGGQMCPPRNMLYFGNHFPFAKHQNVGDSYFHNFLNGKESGWFGAVFFAVASLSSMSSVTVCDKMADSICDTLDHKYTTPQPQLIHHLDQEESHLCPLSLIGQRIKIIFTDASKEDKRIKRLILFLICLKLLAYSWVKSKILRLKFDFLSLKDVAIYVLQVSVAQNISDGQCSNCKLSGIF